MINYALDTYEVFNFNEKEIYNQFASSGRFLTAIVGKLIKILNLSEQTIYNFSSILAIICMISSIYIIKKMIEGNRNENKVFQIAIPILIIFNPFSIELFLYIEKGIMWLAVLMSICAVKNVLEYFELKNKKYILYSMIFMFIANCCYQGVVGIFVAISLVFIIKFSKNIKEFLKNNLIIGLVYIIPAMIDYIIIKISYSYTRVSGKIVLIESLIKILKNTCNMFKTMYNILPNYSFILIIVFTFGVLCYKILKEKNKFIEITKYLYIVIGTIIISVLPQFMQSTDSIWFVARSTYPFASLFGITLLYLYLNERLDDKFIKILTLSIIIIIITLQLYKFYIIYRDRYIVNRLDYYISMNIIQKIKDYEVNTNNIISNIEIYTDKNPSYSYDGIFTTGDINIKAYSTDWSTKAIIEYYLNRRLNQNEQNKYLKQTFNEKDWQEYNEKQIMLKDNVLILCRY